MKGLIIVCPVKENYCYYSCKHNSTKKHKRMTPDAPSNEEVSRRMGPWEYIHSELVVNDADAVDDAGGTCSNWRWVSRWTKLTGAFRGTIKFHAHCIPLECPIVVDIYDPGRYNCDFTHEPPRLLFNFLEDRELSRATVNHG